MRRFLGLMGVLMLWEIAAQAMNHPIFCPVSRVLPALVKLVWKGEAWLHIATSLRHIMIGFFLASVVGVGVGLLITQSPVVDAIMSPVVDAIRPVAALTLFPLLILLFGLGLWSKVVVIFWTAWPPCLLNAVQGVRSVDKEVIEAAQIDGAGRWRILERISLPLALPMLLTGLRIGMSGGWISLVSAEMLGSSAGLGYSILAYSQTFRFPEMYATVVLIAVFGLAMNVILAVGQKMVSENLERSVSHESPFFRFHDRAASFGLDSFAFWLRPRSSHTEGS